MKKEDKIYPTWCSDYYYDLVPYDVNSWALDLGFWIEYLAPLFTPFLTSDSLSHNFKLLYSITNFEVAFQ